MHRACCVATLAVLMAVLSVETVPLDDLSPTSLMETGEGNPGGLTVPLGDVTSMTSKLEAENKALLAQNSALQTQVALAKASGANVPEFKATVSVSPKALPAEVQKGIAVMGDYQKQISALESKLNAEKAEVSTMKLNEGEAKLKADSAAMAKGEQKVMSHYSKIPYFKGFAGAKEIKDLSEYDQCQRICDEQPLCKSFSWDQRSKLCFWSVAALDYDPHYILGVRASALTTADPLAKWREFPGIKFINAQSKQLDGLNEKACQAKCDQDVDCKSYSFRRDTGFCAWSSVGLAYDDDFNYYEKGASMTKAEMAKHQALKQERLVLKNQLAVEAAQAAAEQAEEEKENDAKNAEKAKWMNGTPTKAQETKLKNSVNAQNRQAAARFAAQGAQAAAAEEAAAQANYQKQQLQAVKNLSEVEAEGAKAKSEKKEAAAKAQKLEMNTAEKEVDLAKAKAKLKMAELDLTTHTQSVTVAQNALDDARKSGDSSAIAAAQASYVDAKETLATSESAHANMKNEVNDVDNAVKEMQDKLKKAKSAVSQLDKTIQENAAAIKQAVKQQKANLAKEKLAMLRETEKADAARMIALKSSEKVAKVKRANANVQLYIQGEKMKDIKTDAQRVKLEKEMGAERGVVFKADATNARLTTKLVDAAKGLAKANERADKANRQGNRDKTKKERADVTNKLAALEAPAPANSPFSMTMDL